MIKTFIRSFVVLLILMLAASAVNAVVISPTVSGTLFDSLGVLGEPDTVTATPTPSIGRDAGVGLTGTQTVSNFEFDITPVNTSPTAATLSFTITPGGTPDPTDAIFIDFYQGDGLLTAADWGPTLAFPTETVDGISGITTLNIDVLGFLQTLTPVVVQEFAGFIIGDNTQNFGGNSSTLSVLSGASLEVVFESSAAPVPAAGWLFGSGLLGLIGFTRWRSC